MAHLQDRTSRTALVRAIGPQAARRQLHMSLGLLGVLAVASTGAAFGLRSRHLDQSPARLTVQAPQMVHVQHAQMAPHKVAGE